MSGLPDRTGNICECVIFTVRRQVVELDGEGLGIEGIR